MKSVRFTIRLGILLAALSSAQAQETAPPNVNDCTLIQDPVELRNCVLRFEGNRTPPPVTVESPRTAEPPVSPGEGTRPTDIPAAARPATPPGVAGIPNQRAPSPRAPAAGAAPAAAGAPAPPRPRPSRDTETSIEQVQVPR